MLIQNQVGPIAATASIAPGILTPARAGNLGDLIVSELHGRYYETTYRRASFTANSTAGVTTTVGTAATYTGLALTNPLGSAVNLVLNKVGIAWIAVLAAGAFGVMYGYNSSSAVTQTTAITAKNKFFGAGGSGTGLVATSITAPTAFSSVEILGSMGSLATTGYQTQDSFYDFEGSVILPPGAYAAIYTSVVTTNSLHASFSWEEVPL